MSKLETLWVAGTEYTTVTTSGGNVAAGRNKVSEAKSARNVGNGNILFMAGRPVPGGGNPMEK